MAGRQLFFSFHFGKDNWRASQVRNMGVVDGNKPVSDNDWEQVKKGGEQGIQNWINEQMKYRSCTAVLVGQETAGRKWIKYEIEKSWNLNMGVFGIYIHNLRDNDQKQSLKGRNPFDDFTLGTKKLSDVVQCYNPPYTISTDVYSFIKSNIASWADTAIEIRKNN
jgi:hypothetical protein